MSLKTDVQGFDISDKSAIVVGCGGLGTNAAVHLAGAGIGKLLLVDYDMVEERNLNRQFLYTKNDAGKPKARLLAERLGAYAPEVDVAYHSGRFEGGLAAGFDVMIAAADNVATRREINACSVNTGIPCVNGSINGFFGTAYLCIPGLTPDLEAAGCLEDPVKKNLSPSTTAAVIGALEAQLAVDLFLGRVQSAGKLYIYDDNEIRALKIRSDGID
ncbi:MAG: ThiF family adenylyltransferase [Clostridia bacterium]|nr:ThiF family adenylyltransferase [Clostridia bacterium]